MDRLTFAAQICPGWRRPCQDTIMSNLGDTPSAVAAQMNSFRHMQRHCVHTHCASTYMNNSSRPPCPHHCKAQVRHATWLIDFDRSARGLLPAGSHHTQLAASAPASYVVQHAPTAAAASMSCSVGWPATKHVQQLCVCKRANTCNPANNAWRYLTPLMHTSSSREHAQPRCRNICWRQSNASGYDSNHNDTAVSGCLTMS